MSNRPKVKIKVYCYHIDFIKNRAYIVYSILDIKTGKDKMYLAERDLI